MLQELKAHHRSILQLAFNNYPQKEIASMLDLTMATVTHTINSPLGKAYLNGLADKMKEATIDVRKELISMNGAALKTFSRLLDPNAKVPASVQFATAKDIFDRNGYKAPDKLNIDLTYQNKSDAEIDAEIAALEESIKKTTLQGSLGDTPKEEAPSNNETSLIEEPLPLDDVILFEEEPSPELLQSDEINPILESTSFDPFHNLKDAND